MANSFSKEEVVFFEQVIEGFDPNNITARQVMKFKPPSTQFERSALRVWRPAPYIPIGTEGLTLAASAFADRTQLSVPSELNSNASAPSDIRNVPFNMNAVELNDPLQRNRIAEGAVQQLSAIADSVMANAIVDGGSLFVGDAGGGPINTYAEVAAAEEIMSIRDVPITAPRTLIMNPVDYNTVAGNLAERDAPPTGVSLTAFERSRIPRVATFESFKANFTPTVPVAAATSVTVNGADQVHDPEATDTNGVNVDNRTQDLIVAATGTIAAGDRFTIDSVFAVSHIHKNVTTQLQQFVVTSGVTGNGTITISPAIVVDGTGGDTQANTDYANCDAAPADAAAITFINTVAAPSNIFFANQSVEIVHGSLATMDLDGAGVSTMRMATDSGIEILFAKGADIRNLGTEYRLTMWMTGNVLVPEMCGILLANQT